jgi:hypothetical protein
MSRSPAVLLVETVSNPVHTWDLYTLRRELRAIGLDWDTPVPAVSWS